MHSFPLSSRKLASIERESSGSHSAQRQLCRESVCAGWLRSQRIPCWRNPRRDGYSILFSDGSRILVCGYRNSVLSLDSAAAAGCFGAVAVEMSSDLRTGYVKGFLPLSSFSWEERSENLSFHSLESPDDFLHYLNVPAGYLLTLFIFSARLLLVGEPYPPEKGVGEAVKFTPALTGVRED